MAAGLKECGGGPIVTIEAGGLYDHPQIPSEDIIADLRKNLLAFQLEEQVRIIKGWSDRRMTIGSVRRLLPRYSVDLFVIDADGAVGRDFWIYEPLLADGCVLVFDDYESEASSQKARPVSTWVKRAIRRRMVVDLGVYLWGTWVGQYLRPSATKRAIFRFRDVPMYIPRVGNLTARTRIPVWKARRLMMRLRGGRPIRHRPDK
jgi:hypothetical protein